MRFHLLRSVSQPVIVVLSAILFVLTIQQMTDATEPVTLPNTQLLTLKQPLDEAMVAGIDKFATRALQESRAVRLKAWLHDFNTLEHEAFQKKMAEKRERLKTIIGAVDERVKPTRFVKQRYIGWGHNHGHRDQLSTNIIVDKRAFQIEQIRWHVLDGVTAEGIMLTPIKPPIKACLVVIPDAAWTPEEFIGLKRFRSSYIKNSFVTSEPDAEEIKKGIAEDVVLKSMQETKQLAIELAAHGCQIVIPMLISRESTHSGHPDVFYTNIPHREWIYRMSFQMGRHIIGFEVQKVLAAIDLFDIKNKRRLTQKVASKTGPLPIGVVGVGEGGQIALLAAALDRRIQSTMVCGYFDQRERIYDEPIYRNIWSQLTEFGDAEIAALVAPQALTIEACSAPKTPDPPAVTKGRRLNRAPGVIKTPDLKSVQIELRRANSYFEKLGHDGKITLAISQEGKGVAGSRSAIANFTKGLSLKQTKLDISKWHCYPSPNVKNENSHPRYRLGFPAARQHRQFKELTIFTQNLLRTSARKRDEFWKKANRKSLKSWKETSQWYRNYIHEEMIGKLPEPTMPLNPKSRKVIDVETHTGYEVTIDVYPDIFAGGILLLPKGMKQGEKRAVVVCQHGLEGRPMDTITTDSKSRPYRAYKGFATQLVKQGFIVYAPQNPYRGKDRFRLLQRKSNPLKRSLYSYIIPQHQQTLKWLATLPNVDAKRIAFYGLSYGGKTAVRVPPFLPPKKDQPGYCLSICSGDFDEWVKKCVSDEDKYSYIFHGEYEMWEWNMGHVANYAELATLMTPRPFMVERGHNDGVAPDEWVAWEYAKVRRHYDQIGIGDKTEIEWFNGPHTINGKGTFRFLHKHLK